MGWFGLSKLIKLVTFAYIAYQLQTIDVCVPQIPVGNAYERNMYVITVL